MVTVDALSGHAERPRPVSGDRLGSAGALSVAVFLLFALVTMVNAVSRPIANWDMLPYVASALQRNGLSDPVEIHRQSYAAVRAKVSEGQWADLTANGRYRTVQATDPHAFVSMLPMYQVKGGYVTLVAATAPIADPVSSMRAMSLIAAAATLAGILYAFHGLGALRLVGLTAPALSMLDFQDQASMCSPDVLATAMAVWAAAVIAVRERASWLPVALLVGSVLLRPDMLVATTGLAPAMAAGAFLVALARGLPLMRALPGSLRETGLAAWAAGPLGVAAYALAKAGVSHPGWWPHFWFSFLEQRDTMAGFAPAFDLTTYVTGLGRVFMRTMRDEAWPWLMMALAVGSLLWVRARDVAPVLAGLALFALGVIAARAFAFPLPDARVATPWVLITIIVAAGYLSQSFRDRSIHGHVA